MKRFAALLLAATLMIPSAALASKDVIEVYLNGARVEFDTEPEIVSDRTFVPLRAVAEGLDAVVDWEGETQSITITKDGASNYLRIGDVNVSTEKDGRKENSVLEAAPYIKDERTMVPLRYISEGFGMKVDWNGEDRIISITYEKERQAGGIVESYAGFMQVPDFGKYIGLEAEKRDSDNMYFYPNATGDQKNEYLALLESLGFSKIDEMTNEAVTSAAFEKEGEQVVVGEFASGGGKEPFIGITVLYKAEEYTGEVKYYKDHPAVPDYGFINSLEPVSEKKEDDGSVTLIYKASSAGERTEQLIKYTSVLSSEGFSALWQSEFEVVMTKDESMIIIDPDIDDASALRINVTK